MPDTSPLMRAKFYCVSSEKSDNSQWHGDPYEKLHFQPVVGYGSEENKSFSKYTPSGSLEMTVTNSDLFDKIKIGDVFYLDFTKVGG